MQPRSVLSLSARLGLFLLLAIGLVPNAPSASAHAPSSSVAKAACTPNPEADLRGTLSSDSRSGTVTNSSSSCSYKVGIASYLRFDNNIDNQQLFDSRTATIKPKQTITLSIKLPACSAQVDLFYGQLLRSLDGQRYGERLLAYNRATSGAFCAPTGGRMTGGGSVFTADGQRVTHGFNLRCDGGDKRQRLEINWGNGQRFHLEQLTSVVCSNDPSIDPEHPTSQIDTYTGTGTGRLAGNKAMGMAEWIITDAGEPGVNDCFKITVKDSAGNVLVTADGLLNKGNHQAHR